jgi:hypothetical protein
MAKYKGKEVTILEPYLLIQTEEGQKAVQVSELSVTPIELLTLLKGKKQ